jgi:hypothetical protein
MVGPFAYLSGHPSYGLGVFGESESGARNYRTPGPPDPSTQLLLNPLASEFQFAEATGSRFSTLSHCLLLSMPHFPHIKSLTSHSTLNKICSRKVADSRHGEVNQFLSIYLILPAALTDMSTRKRKIMFLGSTVRSVRRSDSLTVTCKSIV